MSPPMSSPGSTTSTTLPGTRHVPSPWPETGGGPAALVVDFGRHETSAALVTADGVRSVACPAGTRLDSGHLRELLDHVPVRVGRLTLTVSPGETRDEYLRVAAGAGYPDADLVGTDVAAVWDPCLPAALARDGLVLLCDLGMTWSASLLRLDSSRPQPLAEETSGPNVTHAGLDPALRWLAAGCRAVVARAGYRLGDVAGVVLCGGGARIPHTAHVIGAELGLPVWQPPDPEAAVIRGAAAWTAAHATRRALPATPAAWRIEPLSWPIPEPAHLMRWTVAQGQSYTEGACLAQIRTADGRVHDLTAARDGIMLEHRVPPGHHVTATDVLAMTRSAMLIHRDRPVKLLELQVGGAWLLTPDRCHVAECAGSGRYVRVRDLDTGAVVHELRPAGDPEAGRVYVHPGGRMTLVSWDGDGRFTVWDVLSGKLLSRFHAGARPLSVRVDESRWQLASELDRQVSVGRYRRDVACVWDLDTGGVVEQIVGDDLHTRFTGYLDRSTGDGFAPESRSPDGRLIAGSTALDGHAAVWLHRADTDEELFRAELATRAPVRTAFSAAGHHVLTTWHAGDTARLDVWKI